ncbi:MAG: hypothetical protein ACLRIS_20840 [Flavonifractor plautii]
MSKSTLCITTIALSVEAHGAGIPVTVKQHGIEAIFGSLAAICFR